MLVHPFKRYIVVAPTHSGKPNTIRMLRHLGREPSSYQRTLLPAFRPENIYDMRRRSESYERLTSFHCSRVPVPKNRWRLHIMLLYKVETQNITCLYCSSNVPTPTSLIRSLQTKWRSYMYTAAVGNMHPTPFSNASGGCRDFCRPEIELPSPESWPLWPHRLHWLCSKQVRKYMLRTYIMICIQDLISWEEVEDTVIHSIAYRLIYWCTVILLMCFYYPKSFNYIWLGGLPLVAEPRA